MATERPRCRKCGFVIDTDPNVVFPRAGGVEHLHCAKAPRPLTRLSGAATGWRVRAEALTDAVTDRLAAGSTSFTRASARLCFFRHATANPARRDA
jgi:hypothetical protein